jgi:hypothetical protein
MKWAYVKEREVQQNEKLSFITETAMSKVQDAAKALRLKIFWGMLPRSVVDDYQRFGINCCLHLQSGARGSVVS